MFFSTNSIWLSFNHCFDLRQLAQHGDVYKIPIKNKMVSLTALSLGGIIMLPTRNNKSDSVRMKKEKDDRQRLIQAAKKGDEWQ